MKYKLLILSIFISLFTYSQNISWVIKNDSVLMARVIAPGDTVFSEITNIHLIPFGNVFAANQFNWDSAKTNIRNQISTLIVNNSTQAGRNLFNIQTPAVTSVVTLSSSGAADTRTPAEVKAILALDNVNNTSDASKPISTATQTAINNKSTIHFGTDAQANDNYVVSSSPTPSSYTTGMMVVFKAATSNTTGCTINLNGLGVKTIVKRVSTTPATGDILANMFCWLVYDGTNFVLLNPVVN